jgi:hypothetical protein
MKIETPPRQDPLLAALVTGTVDFASGISDNQIWFEQVGNKLQIDILGNND